MSIFKNPTVFLKGPIRVTQRPYILPTSFGLALAGLVFLATLIALSKHLWFFGGILIIPNMTLLVALLLTHRTLKRLEILNISVLPTYAGTATKITLTLLSKIKSPTLVQCHLQGFEEYVGLTLFPKQPTTLILTYTPQKRGFEQLPKLGLSTVYPWGVAQAWAWCEVPIKHWVYPRLQGPSLKWMQINTLLSNPQRGIQGEEFYGLRAYRLGDDKKDMAWKASARSHQLMIREKPKGKSLENIWLDWKKISGHFEEKCSALTKMVVEADRQQLKFGLRLPNEIILPARGRHHRHLCLQKLALLENGTPKIEQKNK